MLRATRMVTDGESSLIRPMPPVTATLVQAEWLIRWSASRMAAATATPPLYWSCSSVPARCCHWAWLMGSLATGVPATMASLDA